MGTKIRKQAFTLVGTSRSYTPSSNVTTLNSQSFAAQQTIIGGVNPRYKAQIAASESATTGLDVQIQAMSVLGGSMSSSYKTSPTSGLSGDELSNYFGLVFGLGIAYPVAGSLSEAEALATKGLYAKIRSTSQQIAGGLFAAELGKTVRLVTRPGSVFLSSLYAYKSNAKRQVAAFLQKTSGAPTAIRRSKLNQLRSTLAGDYLKWTFGAQPLLSDIQDATRAFDRIFNDPPKTRFSVMRSAFAGPTRSSQATQSFGSLSATSYIEDESTSQVIYYGTFQAAKRDPGLLAQVNRVGTLCRFDLRSFVPTIWEVIPYSFLVDYFVNVGDMLEAACTDTSGVRWINRTAINTAVKRFIITPDFKLSRTNNPTKLYQSFSGSPGGIEKTSRTISRQASSVPILVPRINFDFGDVRHMFNIAALVLSR